MMLMAAEGTGADQSAGSFETQAKTLSTFHQFGAFRQGRRGGKVTSAQHRGRVVKQQRRAEGEMRQQHDHRPVAQCHAGHEKRAPASRVAPRPDQRRLRITTRSLASPTFCRQEWEVYAQD